MPLKQKSLFPNEKKDITIDNSKVERVKTFFIEKFKRVKELGFVKSHRIHDTGIGKTFEDLMGIRENNDLLRDFMDTIELKAQRNYTGSKLTLFTKSPDSPKSANTLIREKFGYPDEKVPDKNIIHSSLFHTRWVQIKDTRYQMKLLIESGRLFLKVMNTDTNKIEEPQIFWELETLKKIFDVKCDLIAYIFTKTKKENGIEYFKYEKAILLRGLGSDKFIELIENGKIMFDLRIGIFRSGSKKGKTHDHGSAFRISKRDFKELFEVQEL